MAIQALSITNFRNLTAVNFNPIMSGLNIITGLNGSGKTSLLEAMYYLSHGRSFRTSSAAKIIHHQEKKFTLFAQLEANGQITVPVGIERNNIGDNKLRLANKDIASIMDIAHYLPMRLINSQSYFLFESGPQYRRKYLDWGLFYQNEQFYPAWRYFHRALKQRNALLKNGCSQNELQPWSLELVRYGNELDILRKKYLQLIRPFFDECVKALLDIENVMVNYFAGWDESMDLGEALAENYHDERRLGFTQCGPHRAELEIAIDMIPVKHYLSRGQQKLLICAMILAQGMLLTQETNKNLVYLVDDLPAELDVYSRKKLLALLAKQNTQVFITAIDSDIVSEVIDNQFQVSQRLFHVEHGTLKNS